MQLTAHAGEAYGPESVFQAVTELCPQRIGHGFHLFSKDEIKDESVKDKDRYVNRLVDYIAKTKTTLEVCLTSNFQTMPFLKNIKDHSLGKMLDADLSVTICTDNRIVSKTNLTKEITLAVENFNLTKEGLKKLVINSFEKSFFFGAYNKKLEYIKNVSKAYDQFL